MIGTITCQTATGNAQTPKAEYLLAPDIILLLLQDGSARLLDMGGSFYALSRIGALMLSGALKEGIETTAHSVATTYHAELAQVRHDLHLFLRELEERHLIYRSEKPPRKLQHQALLPSLVLLPLLRGIQAWQAPTQTRAWVLVMLAYLSLRLFGWSRTTTAWQRSYHTYATNATPLTWEQTARDVDKAVRAVVVRYPFAITCKERALCCWALLRADSIPARLVIGVDPFPLASHVWCEFEDTALCDDRDQCARFTPVLSYE